MATLADQTTESLIDLQVPALVGDAGSVRLVGADGDIVARTRDQIERAVTNQPVLLCHKPSFESRFRIAGLEAALDVLELFAFVLPARFCVPTPAGIAMALGLPSPGQGAATQAESLRIAADTLLDRLGGTGYPDLEETRGLARSLAASGWSWGESVISALGDGSADGPAGSGYDIWNRLPEWEEEPPRPPSGGRSVDLVEAHNRLNSLLGDGAEERPSQRDYASFVTAAFSPRRTPDQPNAALAEAGTGVGKTLAYIAPASIWAEQNEDTVWLSTYTKNLQRQIDQELDRRYPDPSEKEHKIVIRKGRENYLCLLNFEEAVGRAQLDPKRKIILGLVARWARYSRDGDMVGGDLPAWLIPTSGGAAGSGLTDRRGECIFSGCAHWRKCFIERTSRRAQHADLVIANHALVMVRAAQYGNEEEIASRYVFDEAHHLFDAADSAYSAHLTGLEAAELRRWLRGPEGNGRRRARGLERRVGDLLSGHPTTEELMHRVIRAAAILPGDGWLNRISTGAPQGSAESFLMRVREHVFARSDRPDDPYSLEASTTEPSDVLCDAAYMLAEILGDLSSPMQALAKAIDERLVEEAGELDGSSRTRLEAAKLGLMRRLQSMLIPWRAMLEKFDGSESDIFVDWFSVDRIGNREVDAGLHRHWIDPTKPFSETVLERAHSVVVTSATLRDQSVLDDSEDAWSRAELRTGLGHLVLPPDRAAFASPFDYANQTKVFVVNDLNRKNIDHAAGAYQALFEAAGGGALGLFTAILRLRAIYERLAEPLAESGLHLLAQHVDAFDPGTLIDIFRAETNSCLLGTDAVRDGIDVPGDALRLIVFDRVPWPRPTVLHRARRKAFGERGYDDMLTRLRLKQAYGRLIRRESDRGVFVMLDAATPTRLLGAFPPGVEVVRAGLADVIAQTAAFLEEAPDIKLT